MTEIAPGQLYDNITNSDYTINYTSNNSTFGDTVYPENQMLSVFGPIYAPRIYGKDLSSFEIASSGAIAITLQDAISLLMERDVSTSNVSFSTPVGDSFGIYTNNSNMSLTFDSTSNNALLYAASNSTINAKDIFVNATDSLNLTSTDFNATFQNDLNLTSGHDVSITGSNDISITGGSNIYMNAGSNISIISDTGSVQLFSKGSNAYISLDSADDTMSLYADNSISATSSNDIFLYASSNVYITAETASLLMSANNSNAYIELDATQNDVNIYSSNASTFVVGDSMTTTIGKDYTLTSESNVSISSKSDFTLNGADSNVTISIDSLTNNMTTIVGNNYSLDVHNSITEVASNNFSITATTGTFDLSAAGSKMTMTMDSATLDTSIYTASNFSVTASNNVDIVTLNDMLISGSAGNITLGFNSTTDDASLFASHSIDIDASTGILTQNGGTAVQMSTDGGTKFTLSNNYNAYLLASNMTFDAGAAGAITTTSGTTAYNLTTSANYTVGGSNIMTILQDKIIVRGNMDIEGTINTIDYNITELHVEDRTVNLSYNSNGDVFQDGPVNTKSGIVVEGLPAISDNNIGQNTYTNSNVQPIYEKSIKWNYNDTDNVAGFVNNVGIGGIGTSNIQSESYWEVKGGGLRLTANKPIIDATTGNITGSNIISFGFRINEHDELELVKKYMSGGQYLVKRVAKFGRTLVI